MSTFDPRQDYEAKKCTAPQALAMLKPGQRVFIGTACGEPQALVRELASQCNRFADLEIVRLMSLENLPLTLKAVESDCRRFYVRSFYLGSAKPKKLSENKRFITPINLSAVPQLFKSRRLPLHAALVQVSPPGPFGWMSLGISVDVTLAAVQSASLVIAQVNPSMPRVAGRSHIHAKDVDVIVEQEEPLLTVDRIPEFESAELIGHHVARVIEDGATLQLSLGAAPRSVLDALAVKNDLGVHTQFMTDGIMELVDRGVVTNRYKGLNDGQCVASGAMGTQALYDFLNENPGLAFFPSDYVNDPSVIMQHHNMTSVNMIMAMDLTGQAAADALPYNHYTGVTGTMDFIRGSRMAGNGKSVLMLPSTTLDGRSSRIVPFLENMAVVVPRGDAHCVATEYGLVNLFGKTLEERALALISIAHPAFRDELLYNAKKLDLVGHDRTLAEAVSGVYPVALEDERLINGQRVVFRPAGPADQRMIQEHFYNLDHDDVVRRFMYEKEIFGRTDVAGMYLLDYVNDLTLVAVIGEIGFEKVIAIGGYYLNPASHMAEVAYSVSGEWQRLGLSRIIQGKLLTAAREYGFEGFVAYATPANQGMIRLFNALPFRVRTSFEDDTLILTARFDELKEI